ncbi:MAG: T9SS type A sorting domain-containing protein [Saprospiraceae bacterium]|nr:T9SS type A sorting domain-containing protein [Saprospiraceae bacterium]
MPADTTIKITFHLKSNEVNGAAKIWLEFYSDKTYLNLFDRTDSLGVVTVVSPNSVSDEDNLFTIYPNPTNNKILIHSKNMSGKEVNISNSVGLNILKLNEIPLDGIPVSEFNSGIYFISIIDKLTKKTTTYNFIKTQ